MVCSVEAADQGAQRRQRYIGQSGFAFLVWSEVLVAQELRNKLIPNIRLCAFGLRAFQGIAYRAGGIKHIAPLFVDGGFSPELVPVANDGVHVSPGHRDGPEPAVARGVGQVGLLVRRADEDELSRPPCSIAPVGEAVLVLLP